MSNSLAVPRPSHKRPSFHIFTAGLALLVLGCGGDGGTGVPAPGGIDVRVISTGPEPDPDGYTVLVDNWSGGPIGVNGSRYHEEIEPGNHTVLLDGLATNCTVAGDNPRTVSVAAGETVTVEFQVTCGATTGSLQISTATGGPSPDPDGYLIALDGSDWGAIGVSTTVTIASLAPGAHLVGLSGVAANCTVEGDNPRAVTIVTGQEAPVSFAVACVQPPPSTGSLRVTTVTTGTDRDPNGYTLTLDGGASQPIGRAATVTLSSVSAGPHTATLGDVAANCTVADANPRTVTVVADTTTEATFVVSCASTRGTLEIMTGTTGADLDPDGYRVRVDDGTGQPIGTTDTLTLPNQPAGAHSVRLVNVAANCTVAAEQPRSVTITAGTTAQVSFAVTCERTTGAIRVTTSTTGTDPDDGYLVALGQTTPVPIAATGSHTFERVPAGTHQVELTGIASNCRLDGENPRSVAVAVRDTTKVAFTVTCSPTTTDSVILVVAGDMHGDTGRKVGLCGIRTKRAQATAAIAKRYPQALVVPMGDLTMHGTKAEFGCYDQSWGELKSRTYATIGNHEIDRDTAATAYYDYFNGVGVDSGRAGHRGRGYYTLDYGEWRILVANSNRKRRVQTEWMAQELAAGPRRCTMAIWHRPLFTSSAEPPDAHVDVGIRPWWQLLYDSKADLILNGHAHNYERFAELGPDGVVDTAQGIREFVVGTGGSGLYGFEAVPHRGSLKRIATWGVLKLTLRPSSYEWQFIDTTGVVLDQGRDICQ